jgi:ComF family protein
MVGFLSAILQDTAWLFYPHICAGCGSNALDEKQILCFQCHTALPFTGFEHHPDNPVEKIFWGRLPVRAAMSLFYFNKGSSVQHLLHHLKYKGKKQVGHVLGGMIGEKLINAERFRHVDALIPLPLSEKKFKQRGYNQATAIAEGISLQLKIPVIENAVVRTKATESQTHKNRIERWENMKDVFMLTNPVALMNKSILLIDDVITTGATLEACGHALLTARNITLNIASVAYTV